MTRRDFELIAECIKARVMGTRETHSEDALFLLAQDFADRLRAVNPRFDRARFMAACGFKGE